METIPDMILGLQRALQQQLGTHVGQMFASVHHFLGAAGVALALGCVHALTPGHGKSIVFTHFIGRDAHPSAGFLVGATAALAHGVVAILLVVLLGGAISRFGRPVGAGAALEVISGGIVAAIGLWYLLRPAIGSGEIAHGSHDQRPRPLLGLAVGILPCPLTMIVFAYAMANEAVAAGLVQAGFVSIGAATTITIIGLGAIVSRRLGLKLLDPSRPAMRITLRLAEIGSSMLVLVLGLAMLAVAVPRVA